MPMPGPRGEDRYTPFQGFNFHVHFAAHSDDFGAPGGEFTPMTGIEDAVVGGFSDISGLEATMEPKVIKAGGRNYGAVQRAGPVTFATVVMKRGIVEARHLWDWWARFSGADGNPNGGWSASNRCDVYVALIKGGVPAIGWKLANAMPIKFRAADLNSRSGEVAIEELHLAHEGLHMKGVV